MPGIEDLTSDLEITSPQVNVEIDRDKAAALGVTANQIENAFYDAYGPRWVSTIYAPVNEYKVLLELAPAVPGRSGGAVAALFQGDAESGHGESGGAAGGDDRQRRDGASPAPTASAGTVVPLDTLAKTTQVIGPQTVNHYGQLPAVTISFGLAPGASLGDVLTACRKVAERDAARRRQRRSSRAPRRRSRARSATSPCCSSSPCMVVYIVLGILYESYIHPLTILSGLPSAGVRRAGHADRLPHGSEHLRVRRHDHADRHRREERDHADRLRARSRARRHDAGAGDLPGLPDPLPADHDDDDGGAARRGADRASATAPAAKRGSRSAWSWSAACSSRSSSRCI